MLPPPLHIVFTGGGTGGHLFPGLAVAERLAEQLPHMRITFAGSGKPFERRRVAEAGFQYLALPCRPVPQRAREAFSFVIENFAGYLAARRFLVETDVAVVVGLGGYASVPMGRAAARRGVPLVLLEQNAVPGRATRWLAWRATLICLAMPSAGQSLRCRCAVEVTGNPIRDGFRPAAPAGRQLLVLGGSGGARSLNESVPRALYKLRGQLADWRIIHQAGELGLPSTRNLYHKLALEATVFDFIPNMPAVLTASALAVCRSGGTTLAELAVAGVPAVLLPYPHATGDHQRRNAEVYAAAGGAVVLDERELPGRLDNHLAEAISPLLADPRRRADMSSAMRRLSRPEAAAHVAALLLSIAGRRLLGALAAAA
jgi:UDP-N-acetylglucosamine--N-acetylmuramyl-(pentapeptide) pyrophosphoryl-undecaprenol N-acetylglucosamine transferase